MSVLTNELLASFDTSTLPTAQAETLPPLVYTSSEFYEFERDAIFGHDWLCVGRADQIPNPGDYTTLTIADEPLLVVRDRAGEIRVLSAVCQHRGMLVAEGSGTCTKFTCPYHHWSYALDGRLLGAPAMERTDDFDKSEFSLPSLPVELWQGFIFTNLDEGAAPLAPRLQSLAELLEHYDLEHATTVLADTYEDLPWNWKVMLENFNDSYHANRLHGAKQDWAPSENCEFLPWDDTVGHVTRVHRFNHIDGSFNPTTKTLLPVFPQLSDQERSRGMFALVPPTLCLAIVPDEIAYFIVCPKGPGAITIHIGYCFDPKALDHPLFDLLLEQAKVGVNYYNAEDIWVDTGVQVGLRSRFAPRGRMSWQEETIRQLARWTVARYRARWPQDTPVPVG